MVHSVGTWDSEPTGTKGMTQSYSRKGWIIIPTRKKEGLIRESNEEKTVMKKKQMAHCASLVSVDTSVAQGMYLFWGFFEVKTAQLQHQEKNITANRR